MEQGEEGEHREGANELETEDYSAAVNVVLGPLIHTKAPLALLDFPNYPNVGDSLIWLGQLAYLRAYKPDSRIVWTSDAGLAGWSRLPSLPPETTILINGGGNLGDLWETHQIHRERVIAHYHSHRIIQLPQSIYFQQASNRSRCAEVFHAHPDLTLLVRDRESLEEARALNGGRADLAPDMALCLPCLRRGAAKHEYVALLRTDKERATSGPGGWPLNSVYVTDWRQEPRTVAQSVDRLLAKYPRRTRAIRPLVHQWLARERMRRGCRILSQGQIVITDRLHGHILCTLMGIPHVVLDNSYGKVSRFRAVWRTGEDLCRTAASVEEALAVTAEFGGTL